MNWTTIKDLHRQVQKLWDNGTILVAVFDNSTAFPKRLVFKSPSTTELSENFEEVRQWISALTKCKYDFRIETTEINHRVIGKNTIPKQAWVDTLEDAVNILGKQKQLLGFKKLIAITEEQNPKIIQWLQRYPIKAVTMVDNWSKILKVIDWIKANPYSNIYLRQIDIPGIDTKFIEKNKKTLTQLLDLSLDEDAINHKAVGISQFESRYGFAQKPLRIRLRILDPSIRFFGFGQQDITLTQDNFKTLNQDDNFDQNTHTIFITENEINFLSFPNFKQAIVIFGAGYGFENLNDIKWITTKQVYYWGDIDSHGFAILDQLRAILPKTQSILMDEPTLLAHKAYWGVEKKQQKRKLNRLNQAEQNLFNDLINNRFAETVRLEQEYIGFDYLKHHLDNLVSAP